MAQISNVRTIRAPHGTQLTAKSWLTEAPMRMLMNNLDPEVAERPDDLIVYGGTGRAARNWESFDAIVRSLKEGQKIELRGFGSFRLRERGARMGRNPKTGVKVSVPAKKIPYFKPGKELKELINR